MKTRIYKTFLSLTVLMLCFVCKSQAQTPSIINISQKEVSDAQGDKIQLTFVLSAATEKLELSNATFSDAVTTLAPINKDLVAISPPVVAQGEKMVQVSLPFGESKPIQPKATVATFTFTPIGSGISGNPYAVNFIGSELSNVFQNLRNATDIDALKKKVADQAAVIARLEKLLPQPKLEWNVVEGYRKLRFEATTTKKDGATIVITFKCTGKENLTERFITPDAPLSMDSTFPSDVSCEVAVSEKQLPAQIADRLLISSSKGKSFFTTLNVDNVPFIDVNQAKQVKPSSQSKISVPLKLSSVTKLEADLFIIKPAKPPELVNKKESLKSSLKSCIGVTVPTEDRCQEDVTFEVPTMEFGAKYRIALRGYSDNPLREPALLSRDFDSLPENFTKSILITFTKTGMRFTALTGDVESELIVAPEWANNITANLPFKSQTSKQSKDPFLDLSPAEWLAGVSNQELGTSAPATPAVATPKQLRINTIVNAKDGTDRVAKSSFSFSLDTPPDKKSNDVKNFVSKAAKAMLGQSSGGDAKLSFNTVGGAIASLIGLFVGL